MPAKLSLKAYRIIRTFQDKPHQGSPASLKKIEENKFTITRTQERINFMRGIDQPRRARKESNMSTTVNQQSFYINREGWKNNNPTN